MTSPPMAAVGEEDPSERELIPSEDDEVEEVSFSKKRSLGPFRLQQSVPTLFLILEVLISRNHSPRDAVA